MAAVVSKYHNKEQAVETDEIMDVATKKANPNQHNTLHVTCLLYYECTPGLFADGLLAAVVYFPEASLSGCAGKRGIFSLA